MIGCGEGGRRLQPRLELPLLLMRSMPMQKTTTNELMLLMCLVNQTPHRAKGGPKEPQAQQRRIGPDRREWVMALLLGPVSGRWGVAEWMLVAGDDHNLR